MIASNNLKSHQEWLKVSKAYIPDLSLTRLMEATLDGDAVSSLETASGNGPPRLVNSETAIESIIPTHPLRDESATTFSSFDSTPPNSAPHNPSAINISTSHNQALPDQLAKLGLSKPASGILSAKSGRTVQQGISHNPDRSAASHIVSKPDSDKENLEPLPVIDLTQVLPLRDSTKRPLQNIESLPRKRAKPDDAWRLVSLLESKVKIFQERFEISESTSLSLDAKQDYYNNVFEKKINLLNSVISKIRAGFDPGPLSTPSPPSNSARLTTFPSNHIPTADPPVIPGPSIVDEVWPPPPPIPNVEDEDEFGENMMDGLSTPPNERDDFDDLGSFIDDTEALQRHTAAWVGHRSRTDHTDLGVVPETDLTFTFSSDNDYEEDSSSTQMTPPSRPTRDEIDDIRLSPDVAANFGIEYSQRAHASEQISEDDEKSDSSNEDVEEIEDFTTQLNDEREINVIELISDDDDEGEEYIDESASYRNLIKNESLATQIPPFTSSALVASSTQQKSKPQLSNVESDFEFSDDDDELMNILNGDKPIPVTSSTRAAAPAGSEGFIDEIYTVLNNVFKLLGFRQHQLDAVAATLLKKDVFVLMPTGGGKSLCYQLPALIQGGLSRGTTIVISPLISLMQDQVKHLLDKNIRAGMILSKASSDDNKQTINLFRDGFLLLVYLSPEKANTLSMIQRIIGKLHENDQLARVVIDEAHCLSSWGHDFRPDYQGMGFFKEKFPDVPIMALTATANEKVRMDIVHNLKMRDPVLLKQSFNRSNLFYEIKWKVANFVEWIRDYVNSKQRGKTGIIYCHSKQSCEQTSAKLTLYGIKAAFYHAGMSAEDRFTVQSMWQLGEVKLICATIAFGMGIDKPNVRYVIHLYIPRSLEGYYQETGRAGRDGNYSECIMFYSYRDARMLQSMIQRDEELTREGKENHLAKLRQVVQYCENTSDCRRQQVLQYFNESFDPAECKKQCDNCANANSSPLEERDCTEYAKDIINLVRSITGQKVTVLHCQDVFKGASHSKIMKMGHNTNPYHGKGKGLDKTDVERIFFYLLSEDCLQEYQVMKAGFASNYVRTGKNANKVLNGQKTIKITFSNNSNRGGSAGTSHDKRPTSSGSNHLLTSSVRSSAPQDLTNFRFQELFISAREVMGEISSAISLPPSTKGLDLQMDGGLATIEAAFTELRKARVDALMSLGIASYQVISEATLRDMAIKVPTNKKDFSKLEGISKEQVERFGLFKRVLSTVARDRKKTTVSTPDASLEDSAANRGSDNTQLPYFATPEKDDGILNVLRGALSLQAQPVMGKNFTQTPTIAPTKQRRPGGRSQRGRGSSQRGGSQRGSSQRRAKNRGAVSKTSRGSLNTNVNHRPMPL